jgi:hypothetical protein
MNNSIGTVGTTAFGTELVDHGLQGLGGVVWDRVIS